MLCGSRPELFRRAGKVTLNSVAQIVSRCLRLTPRRKVLVLARKEAYEIMPTRPAALLFRAEVQEHLSPPRWVCVLFFPIA